MRTEDELEDYLNKDSAGAETDLSLVEEGGPDNSVNSFLQVGVIEDNSSVLAAKLQRDFLHGGGSQLGDLLPNRGGASEGDDLDLGVGDDAGKHILLPIT